MDSYAFSPLIIFPFWDTEGYLYLGFKTVDDGDEFPLETTTSRSRTAGQSYPRAKPGSTRVHQEMCQCSPLWVHTCSYRKCLGRGHGLRLEGDGLVGGIRWEPPT